MVEQRWRGQLLAHSEQVRAAAYADLCGTERRDERTREATAPQGGALLWREGRAENSAPQSRVGALRPGGADQHHSDITLLATPTCLSTFTTRGQRLACQGHAEMSGMAGGVDRRHGS
jgi:hypothetical protein